MKIEEIMKEEKKSRRAFLIDAAKGTLPILAAIALSTNPVVAKAVKTPSYCDYGCRYGCDGNCVGTCNNRCNGTCNTTCSGGCYHGCMQSCSGSCNTSCQGLAN